MATYNIEVDRLFVPRTLDLISTNYLGCYFLYEIEVNGIIGDSINLEFTINSPSGYSLYELTLDEGLGFTPIADNYTFTLSQLSHLRIRSENTGNFGELIDLTMLGTNITQNKANSVGMYRGSTSTIC